MSWKFSLLITNATDRDLEIGTSSVEWGRWCRDNINNRAPCTVPAGRTVEALGVRASSGTWTGYECHAQWRDVVPESETSYGAINLMVNVPFTSSNSSSLTVGGSLKVDGWTPLPEKGSDFTRAITVRLGKRGKLVATVDEKIADSVEAEYATYLTELAARNPDVRDWTAVRDQLTQVEHFDMVAYLPKRYSLSERLLARSEPQPIEKDYWDGIYDPEHNDVSKEQNVAEYFAVALYSVGTDPRRAIPLAAGQEKRVSAKVTFSSALKHVRTKSQSLDQSLSVKAGSPALGAEVAYNLNLQLGVVNVLEESSNTTTEHTVEDTFKAPAHDDLVIVPWLFSTAVIIYRKNKKTGNYGLVAVSEWVNTPILRSYLMSTKEMSTKEK